MRGQAPRIIPGDISIAYNIDTDEILNHDTGAFESLSSVTALESPITGSHPWNGERVLIISKEGDANENKKKAEEYFTTLVQEGAIWENRSC